MNNVCNYVCNADFGNLLLSVVYVYVYSLEAELDPCEGTDLKQALKSSTDNVSGEIDVTPKR